MRRAAFLDRDGTIIEDTVYPIGRGVVALLPDVGKAIAMLNKSGFKVIVISNQAGVARGYFTEDEVVDTNQYICELLASQGAFIEKMYYCPHHISGTVPEYSFKCECRKPNPGMIEKAADELDIDVERSFVIGDGIADMEAGQRAGCRTIFLAKEIRGDEWSHLRSMTDYVASNLYEAAKWLVDSA